MSKTSQIFDVLRKRWATAGDLQWMGLSQCPWARINESQHKHLKPGEVIAKRRSRRDGLQEMKIIKATRWTA